MSSLRVITADRSSANALVGRTRNFRQGTLRIVRVQTPETREKA
jgi:hypothetical protein